MPAGLSNAVAVAAGSYHSLALRSDGTIAAWGNHIFGQTNIPAGLSNVVAVAAGAYHSLALRSDGTVVAWGNNADGETNVPSGISALNVLVSDSLDTNAPGSYVLTYTASNGLGGIATITRTVVVQDTTPPALTLLGDNPMIHLLNTPFVDPGVIALDACDSGPGFQTNNTVNVAVLGDYTVTYIATDASGNSATNTRNVTVIVPPPVLVTTTNDSGPGSLRQAVADALPGAAVNFTNTLSGQTILLTSGEITVIQDLTIDASALAGGIAIDGNATGRLFEFVSGTTSLLASLTLTNGLASGSSGGAIYLNNATLTVSNCTLSGNVTHGSGGGIHNEAGTLTIVNSTLFGNSASNSFGPTSGGGIANNSGTLTILNSTVSGNIAVPYGGGLASFGPLYLTNTIVAGNTASFESDIFGDIDNAAGNLTNGNPMLAPLGNYGGPTQTMPPLPGSPAINAGNNAAASAFTYDQRGYARVIGGTVDIGAVEGVFNPNFSLINPVRLGNGTFQFSFANLNGASFTVFASTNVALSSASWSNLGPALETPPGSGQFQFTDPGATNYPQRYYRVKSP